jgi:hypothetical protein
MMVKEVSKGHHHGGGQSPPEAPSACEVVHTLEKLPIRTFKQLWIQLYQLLDLVPFIFDILSVDMGLVHKFIVIQEF